MDLNWQPASPEEDGLTDASGATAPSRAHAAGPADTHAELDAFSVPTQPAIPNSSRRRRLKASGTIVGALLIGGAAGSILLAPALTAAQTPTAPAPSSGPSTGDDHPFGMGRFGGHNEAVSDTSVAAKAIGISEADLITALQGGQTMAAVAKAHNVDPQVVIDALVADGKAELAAAVKAGTMTQAQADAEQAEVVQRVTDQVNGTFRGGMGGHMGPGMGDWH